jgi:hypothetical protein
MVRSVEQLDGVAGADLSLGLDRQVGAGTSRFGESVHEPSVTHAKSELEARNPWFGHAQQRAADPPALTDDTVRQVDTGDREVVAERARFGGDAEHGSPPCIGSHESLVGLDPVVGEVAIRLGRTRSGPPVVADRPLEQLRLALAVTALDATHLDSTRIRSCANRRCILLYYDTTKSGSPTVVRHEDLREPGQGERALPPKQGRTPADERSCGTPEYVNTFTWLHGVHNR